MRFNLRLLGRTASGKRCVMEASVYASSQKQLQTEAHKMAEGGPWYYQGTSVAVPETEKIIVHNVEQVKKPKQAKGGTR